MAKKPAPKRKASRQSDQLGVPYVKDWPLWAQVSAGVAFCVVVAVLLGWLL